jgi:hypothetical protein
LIGIAEMIQPGLDVAVICSNAAGFRATAKALAQNAPRQAASTDAVASVGLSPSLARLLANGHMDT